MFFTLYIPRQNRKLYTNDVILPVERREIIYVNMYIQNLWSAPEILTNICKNTLNIKTYMYIINDISPPFERREMACKYRICWLLQKNMYMYTCNNTLNINTYMWIHDWYKPPRWKGEMTWLFPLKMLQHRNPPNSETQIPWCKFKLNQNLNLIIARYREIRVSRIGGFGVVAISIETVIYVNT